ncbi:hypothetical protein B1207_15410 [Legionella quinlivanii]|uniref:Uncharacterized protein n=1 Tax=Legionella quinlivanii TaxID=45073 RepID=A0A364LF35_9GAMM|nr:hypothetical protein [Legionella quinlivanii]RAP34509.1 hypothetical protein B1207_15410 [Legionella quinlivanii]
MAKKDENITDERIRALAAGAEPQTPLEEFIQWETRSGKPLAPHCKMTNFHPNTLDSLESKWDNPLCKFITY